ncbi:GntR family transcriptional regulator [Gulosibacter sp. 10]|uniref:GntR family transcriptional regulator n=1 Tax=Gulosibacter sp. 10 TaxID=1255570 RepID=UPI000B35FE9B|nr:GntR family transcriptional regulator [Gulosibacter sp. 10]
MTTTTPATELSKSQQAYAYLRDRIASGAFGPGYRLVLGQIASELGFSTVPVREAIRMLEAEGVVTYVHNVGAQVTTLDRGVYRDTMETLSLVEGFATAQSAPRLTAAEIAEAREINARMRELAAAPTLDASRFTRLNREFHSVLFQHCRNEHIADLVRRGWHRLETMRESSFGFVPERTAESVAEHEELLRLIESGAGPEVIERQARLHRQNTMHAVLASIDD